MRVGLSRLALAELDEILLYIGKRSPRGARNVEAHFRHALDLIGKHPLGAERVDVGEYNDRLRPMGRIHRTSMP
jgi:plasmid stabilization system protein ParE